MKNLMDLHNHCEFSYDSETPMEENVKAAVEKNLKYLSITDHLDLFYPTDKYMDTIDIPGYFEKHYPLQEKYQGKIDLLAGIEVGIQEETAQVNDTIVEEYNFDFVIGSVHALDCVDLYMGQVVSKFKSLEDFYKYYYEGTQRAVEASQNFDVLGHIDYMDRYIGDVNAIPPISNYKEYILPTLESLISRGKGIEINTGGPIRGLPYNHPKREVLEWYKDLGGKIITIGSDAHTPDQIGEGVVGAMEMLKEIGFETVSIFKKRKQVSIDLI